MIYGFFVSPIVFSQEKALAAEEVGVFSALGNLGAGGLQDVQLSDIANSVLYSTFFIGGFFAGSINVTPLCATFKLLSV